MSTEISKIVNSFIKFLKQDKIKVDKLNSIDDILKIPISSYNFLNKELASKLTELFEIVDIESAAKLKKDKIFKYYLNLDESKEKLKLNENEKEKLSKLEHLEKKYHDFKRILEKLIKISSIILSVKKKEAGFEIDAQKVVVAGLDNAGKTAILSKFGDKLGLKDLLSLKPTKGVERRHIKIKNSDVELFVLDLGGQVKYRSNYLKNPEKYFLNTTLLIYVIDIQDPNRFHESFNYFEEILNTLILLEENPYLMVYIHKYDPDLRHDPEILLNVEFVRDNLSELLGKYDFEYDVYLTSIFSLITNEPEISKYLKEVMKTSESLNNPMLKKIEGLGKTLEETMNMVIRLSESLSKQLNDLDTRLRAIESGAFQIVQKGIPIDIQVPSQGDDSSPPRDSRTRILEELKQLFEKKKKLNL